jgi:uncharacterized protein (UPF0305 family)
MTPNDPSGSGAISDISLKCRDLQQVRTRGELGESIAAIVMQHSPVEILQMKRNFDDKIQEITPEYRERLTKKITEHLLGTYQRIRLAQQQGIFRTMLEPVGEGQVQYWNMVQEQCQEDYRRDVPDLRFLKYLLAGFCMLVLKEPGHPVGTPFPGGDSVQTTEGVYYCPVRNKANDVDAALCPFCPALQTPEIGYLRPPTNPSERKKQEFIEHCHRFHNFNG